MQVNIYMVRVRLVSDVKGPLEAKPQRVVITLALNHAEALRHARDRYADLESAGVVVEYGDPSQLADTVALESLVYA